MMTLAVSSPLGRSVTLAMWLVVSAFFQQRHAEALANPVGRPKLAKDCHSLLDAESNGIAIRNTKSKGMGAFLGYGTTEIKAGQFLGEYKGEFMTGKEVEARYWGTRKMKTADRRWRKSRKQRQQGLSGDYLFDMGDDIFLDAEDADVSSWCRFMNHASEVDQDSCCNVETMFSPLRCNDGNENGEMEMPRLWFVARRDIVSGEELLYDYGDSYWSDK